MLKLGFKAKVSINYQEENQLVRHDADDNENQVVQGRKDYCPDDAGAEETIVPIVSEQASSDVAEHPRFGARC